MNKWMLILCSFITCNTIIGVSDKYLIKLSKKYDFNKKTQKELWNCWKYLVNESDQQKREKFFLHMIASSFGDYRYDQRRFLWACGLYIGLDLNSLKCDRCILHDAVMFNDCALASLALSFGLNPNKIHFDFRPIECVRSLEMAKLLIKYGAEVTSTELTQAVSFFGDWQILELFLKLEVKWQEGASPFERVIAIGPDFDSGVVYYKDNELNIFKSKIENILKKVQLLYVAGYGDSNKEIVKKIEVKKVDNCSKYKKLLIHVLQNRDFNLDECMASLVRD